MPDLVGQQLGNYRLVRLLGHGGFADVYLGEHVFLQTQAAIKILQTRVTDSDMEGFVNEARTIALLKHPHIIRILDFGVQDNIPFLVMEYAPNGTLRQRYPKGTRLSPATIVSCVNQVASALQYAHEQKLIHRDVKPENMLLGANHEILLGDFGIAMLLQTSRYQAQEVIGTVVYMAPEQLQGQPRSASDQYSLGIVAYEWICGDRPFKGSFTETYSQHLFVPPPSLREKIPELPLAVEQVVMKALAKEPQQRFASVQEFAHALEQACRMTYSIPSPLPPIVAPPGQPSQPTTTQSPHQTYVLSPSDPSSRFTREGQLQGPDTGASPALSSESTGEPPPARPLQTVQLTRELSQSSPSMSIVPSTVKLQPAKRKISWHIISLCLVALAIVSALTTLTLASVFPSTHTPGATPTSAPRLTATATPTPIPTPTPTATPTQIPTPTPMATPTATPTHTPTATPTPSVIPNPTPTPTPTPTPKQPKLSARPTSFNLFNDPNCKTNSTSGVWTCYTALTNNGEVSLSWSASSRASVTPSSGTLSPGKSILVAISGQACINVTVTFLGPVNSVAVTVNCSNIG
jgi:eukaryotic-like serine/threonine-protein kinase